MEQIAGYIAVMAGTTESRGIIEKLQAQQKRVRAFVATSLGREMLKGYSIEIEEGRKTKEMLKEYFILDPPEKVYDATHPFAEIITKNVKEICRELQIPYERTVREHVTYEYEELYYVADTDQAIGFLKGYEGAILLTTGAKTAAQYKKELTDQDLYIRVLAMGSSKQQCLDAGYEESHILAVDPPFSVEDQIRMIRETGANILVTKNSGIPGGVPEKIAAAKACQIPVLMIEEPERAVLPRVLITAAGSGSGKTTITTGLMEAFLRKGKKIQGFKCGPDYIDPMYHTRLTGRPSVNLDPYFYEGELSSMVFEYGKDADLGILEGVMGFYDGMGSTTKASTYETARETETPVILVMSVKGIANTIIPIIQGLLAYKENTIAGVILNQCSKGFYEQIKERIEEECGILAVGYVPKQEELRLESRHLGLTMAHEQQEWEELVRKLGNQMEQTVDCEQILRIAHKAKPGTILETERNTHPVTIGIAEDEAFCFYYEDNKQELQKRGVTLVSFSPLHDTHLPKGIQGIYLGGGYPELYAGELEKNTSMKEKIRVWCQAGKPLIAECGGYMYLGASITDQTGDEFAMCQAFSHKTKMRERLNMHFGYVKIHPEGMEKGPWKGHEFHYSSEEGEGFNILVEKNKTRSWNSGYYQPGQYAAYPHLPFRGNETFLEEFLEKAKETAAWND